MNYQYFTILMFIYLLIEHCGVGGMLICFWWPLNKSKITLSCLRGKTLPQESIVDGYCARFLTLFCGTVEEITSTNCKGLTACLHVSMDDYKLVHRMVLKKWFASIHTSHHSRYVYHTCILFGNMALAMPRFRLILVRNVFWGIPKYYSNL